MRHPIPLQIIESKDNGLRVDKYIVERLSGVSRTAIQKALHVGLIKVNGRSVKPSHALNTGDTVEGSLSDESAPSALAPENILLDILYEDDQLIAINKPSSMVVHPGAGCRTGTLAAALLYHFGRKGLSKTGDANRPGIVHRLDKETSGVILAAKKNAAHLALARLFKDREIKKEYRTIVWGEVRGDGEVDRPIARSRNDRIRMIIDPEGREAKTRYSLVRTNGWISELLVKPETGRTHQIRVHLASVGHPVVGDTLYGGGEIMMKRIAPLFRGPAAAMLRETKRVMLHAQRITFQLPKKKKKMVIEAPLPKDFKKIQGCF